MDCDKFKEGGFVKEDKRPVCKGSYALGTACKNCFRCEMEELLLFGPRPKSPDSNVEKNREMLLQRSIVGLAKYGVTTDNNPLDLRDWLQHALEEALDMANYLQAAISKLDEERAKK